MDFQKAKRIFVFSLVILLFHNCLIFAEKKITREIRVEAIADLNFSFFSESFIVSPDVKKVAFVERIGSGSMQVVVNDKPENLYDNIGIGTPIFAPNSEYVAYFAFKKGYSGGMFNLFSSKSAWLVISNQTEISQHDDVIDYSLIFSPDSRHIAYAVSPGNLVIDGIPKHWYKPDEEGNFTKEDITLDDYFGLEVSMPFLFSPDSKRLAFVRQMSGGWCVIVDSLHQKKYDNILLGTPIFSPDSKKIVYAAVQDDRSFIVLDGVEGTHYDGLDGETITFSLDSKRLAFACKKNGKWHIDLDGELSEGYDDIGIGSLVFSSNSKRLVYTAQKQGKWIVVLDGQEIAAYDRLVEKSLAFSPDSKKLAFAAARDDGFVVVDDGRESIVYEALAIPPVYSPNGKYLAFGAQTGLEQYVVINSQEGGRYPTLISHKGGKIVFDSNKSLHYLALKDDQKIYLIEETLK